MHACIGEGNGSPLQCPCLENPWDGGAWWAAIYGVAQSRAQLKRLGSSSSSQGELFPCLFLEAVTSMAWDPFPISLTLRELLLLI